jgi:glycopeptide antibiotics resistance protein
MFCLFWVINLKCNLRAGVLDARYYFESLTFAERLRVSFCRFASTDLPDALVNIFVFVPMGLVFPLIREKKPVLTSAILGFSVSLAAELFQLITCIGAFTYIDIINNTLGAVIGGLIHLLILKFVSEKQAKIILIAAIIFGSCASVFAIVNTIINIEIYF